MASQWKIFVKVITGKTTQVNAVNGADTTVQSLKEEIEKHHDMHPPPHRQRLIFSGNNNVKLKDNQKLLSYNINDGSTLQMIILDKFLLYVIGLDLVMYELEVPSSTPEVFQVADLLPLLKEKTGQNMSQCQVLHQNEPLEKVRHGKEMSLKDYDIKSSATLTMTQLGITLEIVNPQVDLCFLVDCTGSMESHIVAVKNCIKKVRDDLEKQFQGCDIRFAFVRYTDYDVSESSRTSHIDFTKDQQVFYNFVDAIHAQGGGDGPEDVMGGLQAVFSRLTWGEKEVCKVIVHVADWPCHGTQYHTESSENHPGGDPAGISHEQMMQKVADQDIQYWFGYIDPNLTDQMIRIFNESLQQLSKRQLLIRQISAQDPKEMGDAVNRSVMGSIYGAAAARRATMKPYNLNKTIPEWGAIPEMQGKKTSSPPLRSMEDLQKGLKLDPPSINISVKCAPDPFNEGSESIVYHGYDVTNKQKIVLKKYKREGDEFNNLGCYMKELMVRTITNTYVQGFNDDKTKPSPSTLLVVHPVEIVQCQGSQQIYMLETFLKGNVEKYNNNAGIVCTKAPESDMMQAFSHYSWAKSGRSLLICDLQGVQSYSTVILTDPAIHSMMPGSYGFTDHGEEGIKLFFKSHRCGNFCTHMGLNSQLP